MSKPGLSADVTIRVVSSVDFGKLSVAARTTFLEHAVLDVHRFAAQAAPSDTGMLKGSLSPGGDGSIMEMHPPEWAKVGTKKFYGYVLEVGRKPGGAMPPPGSLLGWMNRHSIDPSLEYPIRRAIGIKGIMQYKGWFSSAVDQGMQKAEAWTKASADVLREGWDKA